MAVGKYHLIHVLVHLVRQKVSVLGKVAVEDLLLLLEKPDEVVARRRYYHPFVLVELMAQFPVSIVRLRLFHQEAHVEKSFGEW